MPFDVGNGEVFAARRERRACKRVQGPLHLVCYMRRPKKGVSFTTVEITLAGQ